MKPGSLFFATSTPASLCLSVACLLVVCGKAYGGGYTAIDLYSLTDPPNVTSSHFALNENAIAARQTGGYGFETSDQRNLIHGVYWNAGGTPVDVNPAGAFESQVFGTDGIHQVGGGPNDGRGFVSHAYLWSGTAASAVNLSPAASSSSTAYGVAGVQQSGFATIGGAQHAALWTGSAGSFVDLNGTNFASSIAYATDGTAQVGECQPQFRTDAVLWTGTAASFVDLAPASGFDATNAYGVANGQQVGAGFNNRTSSWNALLWNGSAGSVVDLNPAGDGSFAYGTNGQQQVGQATSLTASHPHAAVWSGSASSLFDLQTTLPSYLISSNAESIDSAGNIFGYAIDTSSVYHAVEWTPNVPEPSLTTLVICCGAVTILRRRRPMVGRQ